MAQILSAQAVLVAALAELANADPTVRERLRSQISQIAGLRQQVGTAQGGALSALRAEVAGVADRAATAVQDARTSAAADPSSTSTMATLAQTAREQTNSVMAGMKDFDADLKFSSAENQAAYREREAERQSYIAAQQAKHTPEGDLNASGGAVGQMADAAAHGAHGAEFDRRWNELTTTTEKLREVAKANGVPTEEFDRHLREDLRKIMKSKGLTDAQIDAKFVATTDPLEAAKAYVKDDDVKALSQSLDSNTVAPPSAPSQPASTAKVSNMDEAMAEFRAAGVTTAEPTGTSFVHGVAVVDKPTGKATQTSLG